MPVATNAGMWMAQDPPRRAVFGSEQAARPGGPRVWNIESMTEGAESLDLNEFHTVRTINPHWGSEQFAGDRAIVAAHVGRYIIDWAHLECTLNMVVATWNGTAKDDVQSKKMARIKFANQIKFLREQFKPDWHAGQVLLDTLLTAKKYRNGIAQWSFGHTGKANGIAPGRNLHEPQSGFLVNVQHLSIDSIRDAEATLDVADKALSSLMGPPYWNSEGHRANMSAEDLNAYSLAQVIIDAPGTWDSVDDLTRFREKAWAIFPPPV